MTLLADALFFFIQSQREEREENKWMMVVIMGIVDLDDRRERDEGMQQPTFSAAAAATHLTSYPKVFTFGKYGQSRVERERERGERGARSQ